MATIDTLKTNGVLISFSPRRLNPELIWRPLWLMKPVTMWLENVLPKFVSYVDSTRLPYEQVDDFFEWYSSGKTLRMTRNFRVLYSLPESVWKMRTDDVEFFGFFAMRNSFIITHADLHDRLTDHMADLDYVHEIVHMREGLELPSYITGTSYDDILSDIIE